jgi:hypothetical protein
LPIDYHYTHIFRLFNTIFVNMVPHIRFSAALRYN